MGNVPNRQGGRRRRNKTDHNGLSVVPRVVKVGNIDWEEGEESSDRLVPAPAPDEDWHPVALELFEAMKRSGQRVYYEPSDWALAYLVCDHISKELNPKFVGTKKVLDGETSSGLPILVDEEMYETVPLTGGSLQAILKAMEKLMLSEPDRRKARVEIERGAIVEEQLDDDIVASRMQLISGEVTG